MRTLTPSSKRLHYFLASVFLLIPTVACAQVIEPPGSRLPGEQTETEPEPLWPEQNKITPPIVQNLQNLLNNQNQNQKPPYGTVVTIQKPVNCNDTPVVKKYVQITGGMAPVTFGTNLNQMGAITSLIQMYANPVNKQFAVVEHFATQKSCILTQGHNFEMLVPAPPVVN
mgnify:FL=1